MWLFALRYFFVYWILLGGSASEETLLRNVSLIVKQACKLRCMRQRVQQSAQCDSESTERQYNMLNKDCTDHCLHRNATTFNSSAPPLQKYPKIRVPYKMIFICRDDRSLTFRITTLENHQSMQNTTSNKRNSNNNEQSSMEVIYLVKIQNGANVKIDKFIDNVFTIIGLNHSTTYTISALAMYAQYEYAIVAREQEFTTLQRDYTPGLVGEVELKRFLADELNEMHLLAEITWQPTRDKNCYYNILYFDENQGSDMTPMEIRNPRQLYTYTLKNLTFSAVYKIGIRAKNANSAAKESEMRWFNIKTPTCAEWYNYNFNICRPFTPEGLQVECEYVRDNTHALNITWHKAEHPVSSYKIMIVDHIDGSQDYNFSVHADANKFFIPEIKLNCILFDVHLIAFTPGGNSSAVLQKANSVMPPVKIDAFMVFVYIMIIIFCFIIIMTVIIFVHRYRGKVKRHKERCKYFEDLEKKTPIDEKSTFDFPKKNLLTLNDDLAQFQLDLEEKISFNDIMEIDRNNVMLHEVLGEGAFGLVRRGTYNDGKSSAREVAVKMLKDRPSVDDVRAFRREIEVMKSVEPHPNIVGIIGHCTKRCNEMLLLTEYCSFGNLLDFLRDEWKYLYDLNVKYHSVSMKRMSSRWKSYNAHKQQRRMRRSLTAMHPNANTDLNSSYAMCKVNKKGRIGVGRAVSGAVDIDANIIERLKFKYKYKHFNILVPTQTTKCLNSSGGTSTRTTTTTISTLYPPVDDLSSATTTLTSLAMPPMLPAPQLPNSIAADNKSYGYDEICSSSGCKYHQKASDDGDDGTKQQQQQKQQCIHTKMADNLLMLPLKGNAAAADGEAHTRNDSTKSAPAIENKSYFRNLPEIVSETALRQRQWKRRQARTAQRQRKLMLQQSPSNGSTSTATTVTTATLPGENASRLNTLNTLSSSIRREPLSIADLLDIARQVAVGMEFLAKNKVVHRDLAARNVLVATDRTIKIADFGLSRDIYQENVYKKTGNGKLPIKWLALESMTHQVYTTQSDVWSYGILLYEIVTLGGTPYPMIPTNRLLHLLKNGYRMEKPKNCGREFYNLMYACWNVNPSERPSFGEIIKILNTFLADIPEQKIENVLNVPNLECIEHYQDDEEENPIQKSNHQSLYREQPFDEHLQSTLTGDVEIDSAHLDDSYLKPL